MLGLTLVAAAINTGAPLGTATAAPEMGAVVTNIDNTLTVEVPAFPDRTKQAKEAIAYDAEQARLKAETEAKAKAEAEAARLAAAQAVPASVYGANTGDAWYLLRLCESGNNYATNTGNGFYGAYQFDIQTWANYGGYHIPSEAPPATQDAKAHEVQAVRGWSPWPSCGAKLS